MAASAASPSETKPQLFLNGHPGGSLGSLMDLCVYLTVAAGYLVALIEASHFVLAGFLVLTVASLVWAGLFWLMSSTDCTDRQALGYILAMVAVTFVAIGAVWIGAGFDWLLPVIMVAIIASMFPVRFAFLLGGGVWLLTMAALYAVAPRHDLTSLQAPISLLPAFVFAFMFPFIVRRQQEERERVEALVVQLEEARAQLQAYADQVEELAVARERNRMAREIHDTLGHYLTVLAVQLETALKLEQRADPRLRDELAEARRVAAECLAEVRHSVAALRPADPTARSFDEALRRLIAEFEIAEPGTEFALDVEGPVQELPPELRLALYRCIQESLTNIRKHAEATKVLVRLRVDDRQAELTVLDNGKGAAADADGHEPGFGLLGMRERVALLGGTARAAAEPEHGWRVEVVLPVPHRATPTECADSDREPEQTSAQPSHDRSLAATAREG